MKGISATVILGIGQLSISVEPMALSPESVMHG